MEFSSHKFSHPFVSEVLVSSSILP